MLLGAMVQGDWIADDGSTYQPVTVYFDLLRLWDSRAVWHKMTTDLTALSANIKFARSRKAQVMFTFGEPPVEAVAPDFKRVPTIDAWTDFVELMVSVDGIDVFEGWNEPLYPQYWDGSPELLTAFQQVLYTIAKERWPNKPVLSPSFVRVELPDGQEFLKRYIVADGLQWCDALAWHGYCEHSEDLRGQIASLRSFVGAKPLWNTEYVCGTGIAQMKDSLMLQASLDVECAVWNAEMPGFEDYTDPTMAKVRALLDAPPASKPGCLSRVLHPFAS